MFIHVFFLFPETASKPLEEVEDIFDDQTPGSIKYIGTPAWKTHVDRNARRLERGELSEEEKFGSVGTGNGAAAGMGMGAETKHVERGSDEEEAAMGRGRMV